MFPTSTVNVASHPEAAQLQHRYGIVKPTNIHVHLQNQTLAS